MSVTIPSVAEEITAAWMSAALGTEIAEVSLKQIGEGIGVSSALYRARLKGHDPSVVPDTVVVKLPALADEAVFTSTVLSMYRREVGFYVELADESPIRVPRAFHAAVADQGCPFVVVMQDMGDLRVVDQIKGMEPSDAVQAVNELAAWHARWWNATNDLVDRGTAIALSDPIYPAVLPAVFAEGWEKIKGVMEIAEPIRAVGPTWPQRLPALLASLDGTNTTLLHGDYRADNMLFDSNDAIVMLDFQLIGRGSAAYDLAYFVTQSLDASQAARTEVALFERWIEALVSHGVPEPETTDLWQRYREAAFFCLVYPVVASRGVDFDDPRQYQLIDNMNTRIARAIDELNLADLI